MGCAKEKFWQRLTVVLERSELATDPRFATFADRAAHRDELQDILDEVLATRTVEEWLTALRAAAIPCAPVNDVGQALREEHTLARQLIVSTEHPRFGEVKQVASPVRVGRPRQHHSRAPQRGEHTEATLHELLGYDDERVALLTSAGAFGTASGTGAA
jgi:crotonobetainyl-CoA:carnitine CoA-transferase CaiB-like acyl-CoA transferase